MKGDPCIEDIKHRSKCFFQTHVAEIVRVCNKALEEMCCCFCNRIAFNVVEVTARGGSGSIESLSCSLQSAGPRGSAQVTVT
jgi:hypothetical protein